VPLVEMYPEHELPVLQISMPTLDPERLMDVGRRLGPLRDEGVLIVGSGFFAHNLRALNTQGRVSSVMAEFDDWGRRALEAQDVDALLDFEHKAPTGRPAHPRTEHFVPLFVTLGGGAGGAGDAAEHRGRLLAGVVEAIGTAGLTHMACIAARFLRCRGEPARAQAGSVARG
jgi:4,5-DOPA dioxygenase extradiol